MPNIKNAECSKRNVSRINFHSAQKQKLNRIFASKGIVQNDLSNYFVLFVFQAGESVVPGLGAVNEKIERIFDFKSGQVAHTKGIHILDTPFLIDFIENGIKKTVLISCDTVLLSLAHCLF